MDKAQSALQVVFYLDSECNRVDFLSGISSKSELFRNLFPNHAESFRINPKVFYISFDEKWSKINQT